MGRAGFKNLRKQAPGPDRFVPSNIYLFFLSKIHLRPPPNWANSLDSPSLPSHHLLSLYLDSNFDSPPSISPPWILFPLSDISQAQAPISDLNLDHSFSDMLQMHFYEICVGQHGLRVAQAAGPNRPCLTRWRGHRTCRIRWCWRFIWGSKSAIVVASEGLDRVERYDHHRGILS